MRLNRLPKITTMIGCLGIAACFSVDFDLNVNMDAKASFTIDMAGTCSGNGTSEDGLTTWTKTQTEAGCRIDIQYENSDFVPVEDIRQAILDEGQDPKSVDIAEMEVQLLAARIADGEGNPINQPNLVAWSAELNIASESVLTLSGENTTTLLESARDLPTDEIRTAINDALHGKISTVGATATASLTISDAEVSRWQELSQPILVELDIHLKVTKGAKDAI